MNLAELVEELVGADSGGISLWQRLATANGRMPPGNGHPAAKSRPPATLTVVALVMEITAAARESAIDLAGRLGADVPANLRLVAGALDCRDDPTDIAGWWCDAIVDWVDRTRTALGQAPLLIRSVYGACCPVCRSDTASIRTAGERWSVPAIGIDWADDGAEGYEVHAIHCRACGASWLRGVDLDELVEATIRVNTTDEVVGQSGFAGVG